MRSAVSAIAFAIFFVASCTGTVTGDTPGGSDPGGADAGGGGADAGTDTPTLADEGLPAGSWRGRVERVLDGDALEAAFAASGYTPPPGYLLYAARIEPGVEQPAFVLFDAGGGAFSRDFWPASTVKLLAAVGAIDYLRELGFSGAAEVSFAGVGDLGTLRELYTPSIAVSDNLAYTRTLQIAGAARINDVVLVPETGFADTVLLRSYVSGISATQTPEMTLREGDRSMTVPARSDGSDRGCPNSGNCTSLYELSEGMRRVLLHDELPAAYQFGFDAADVAGLQDALCDAESFLEAGAERALGPVSACNKPGWVPDLHYLDHGILEVEATGERFLVAAGVPWPQACSSHTACTALLSELAEAALPALRDLPGVPLQDDAGSAIAVALDSEGAGPVLVAEAPGADRLEVWIDREHAGTATGDRHFALPLSAVPSADAVVTLRAYAGTAPIAHRNVKLAAP